MISLPLVACVTEAVSATGIPLLQVCMPAKCAALTACSLPTSPLPLLLSVAQEQLHHPTQPTVMPHVPSHVASVTSLCGCFDVQTRASCALHVLTCLPACLHACNVPVPTQLWAADGSFLSLPYHADTGNDDLKRALSHVLKSIDASRQQLASRMPTLLRWDTVASCGHCTRRMH